MDSSFYSWSPAPCMGGRTEAQVFPALCFLEPMLLTHTLHSYLNTVSGHAPPSPSPTPQTLLLPFIIKGVIYGGLVCQDKENTDLEMLVGSDPKLMCGGARIGTKFIGLRTLSPQSLQRRPGLQQNHDHGTQEHTTTNHGHQLQRWL